MPNDGVYGLLVAVKSFGCGLGYEFYHGVFTKGKFKGISDLNDRERESPRF